MSLTTKRPPADDLESNQSQPPTKRVKRNDVTTTRAGGVYIPPHRLRKMAEQQLDRNSREYQKMTWDALRKSINGLINKVNISNIGNIVPELFQENIIRGRGLLCRSIIKAQACSPTFTQVYAALISVINAKMPHIGELLVSRLVIQFRKAFQRNDKIQLLAATRFIAHLLNQQVAGEILGLQILSLLLERPTDDSVEVACEFITQCGYVLQSLSPEGFNGVFERFRAILHEGLISKRVQYIIEHVFAVRKSQFAEFPGVIEQLDLIDADDQITHEDVTLDAELESQDNLNYFHFEENFLQNEEKYQNMKKAILADFSDYEGSSSSDDEEGSEEESSDDEKEKELQQQPIEDMTDSKLLEFRRKIYLVIMSSLDYEECAHKILRLDIQQGVHEIEICNMIIECCLQARTFLRFAALLAQRLCTIDRTYQELFEQCFIEQYTKIYRLETNSIRNCAKFFAHLLHSFAINWTVLENIKLNENDTNSSSRIFIKILFQELVEYMGLAKLNSRLHEPELENYLNGLFPRDSPRDTRFAINFFTSIGLGGLTDELREFLKTLPKRMMLEAATENSSSSDDSSDDSSSDDSSSSISSGSSSDISSSSSLDDNLPPPPRRYSSNRDKSSNTKNDHYTRSPHRESLQRKHYTRSRSPSPPRHGSTRRSSRSPDRRRGRRSPSPPPRRYNDSKDDHYTRSPRRGSPSERRNYSRSPSPSPKRGSVRRYSPSPDERRRRSPSPPPRRYNDSKDDHYTRSPRRGSPSDRRNYSRSPSPSPKRGSARRYSPSPDRRRGRRSPSPPRRYNDSKDDHYTRSPRRGSPSERRNYSRSPSPSPRRHNTSSNRNSRERYNRGRPNRKRYSRSPPHRYRDSRDRSPSPR